jgi:hypothetical protein
MADPSSTIAPVQHRVDAQCSWLLERIDALEAEAALEPDPAQARRCRRERRTLVQRARALGCLGCSRGIPAATPSIHHRSEHP